MKQSSGGFGGRSFSFDNGPDRVKKRWLEEEKQSLLSKGEAVSGAGGFEVFDKALCSNCGVSRKKNFSCETRERCPRGQQEMLTAQGCLQDVSTCPKPRRGPDWSLPVLLRGQKAQACKVWEKLCQTLLKILCSS